ncbi:hypothetical protein INR79_21575 [Vibrio sp. SCSIO 43132]|uniref:hypothetical protein n=1 Tax=Vibrio sp. SCSIO 43132 TaxID=2779363 RepID=UPI001CA9CDDB|nr:hypothetical protein [Vibrio sp. SCSIO 43132]UAB73740.1 hypothetical protein INR79_21575 [Vibrio sp. SCSIO 43132]
MIIEIALAIFTTLSALLGALTLIAEDFHDNWWRRKAVIAKSLAINSFIVFFLCGGKIYFDSVDKSENQALLAGLESSLSESLSKQHELEEQLSITKTELKHSIENANLLELQYRKNKELQSVHKWRAAFLAEKKINTNLLTFLADDLNNDNRLLFLYQPSYLKNNYLIDVMKSSHVTNQRQLELMTLLYNELNEINEKIKAGSGAVLSGNYEGLRSGFSRFIGVENNAKNALNLYEQVASEL